MFSGRSPKPLMHFNTASSQCLLVDSGPNPSTDYFVKPCLQERGLIPQRANWQQLPPREAPSYGSSVVFVRYLSRPWQHWVTRYRDRFESVYYFMDDDLFDAASWSGQRWGYRWRLFQRAHRFQAWLKSIDARLWVSTSALARKYADWQPDVLPVCSPYSHNPSDQSVTPVINDTPIVFYHGSASHEAEMKWLVPVFKGLLTRHRDVQIEVIADTRIQRHFSSLKDKHGERLQIVEPMPWPDYQQFITQKTRTVGLAPLLDTPFNAYRAPTKQFDIEAAQATGLFARHPAFANIPQSSETPHQLLPMDQQLWQEVILEHL